MTPERRSVTEVQIQARETMFILDGGADAETAFRVRRVSYSYMLFDPSGTQVFGGGGG